MTTRELAEDLGATLPSIRSSIVTHRAKKTHNPDERIHICGWERSLVTAGGPKALWALGDKPDAPRPKPLSNRETKARQYTRHCRLIRLREQAARGVINPYLQLVQR